MYSRVRVRVRVRLYTNNRFIVTIFLSCLAITFNDHASAKQIEGTNSSRLSGNDSGTNSHLSDKQHSYSTSDSRYKNSSPLVSDLLKQGGEGEEKQIVKSRDQISVKMTTSIHESFDPAKVGSTIMREQRYLMNEDTINGFRYNQFGELNNALYALFNYNNNQRRRQQQQQVQQSSETSAKFRDQYYKNDNNNNNNHLYRNPSTSQSSFLHLQAIRPPSYSHSLSVRLVPPKQPSSYSARSGFSPVTTTTTTSLIPTTDREELLKGSPQQRNLFMFFKNKLLTFGSSALAAAIPFFVYLLPDATSSSITRRGANLLLEGPKILMQRQVGSMMSWIERSVEQLPSFPSLHPQECVKRGICEAHLMPERYGVIGFTLRLLFPASSNSHEGSLTASTDATSNASTYTARDSMSVINKYKIAANYGLNKRIGSNGNDEFACREYYEGCLISPLDVVKKMTDIFIGR